MLGESSSGSTLLMDLMDSRGRAGVAGAPSFGSSAPSSGSVASTGLCCFSSSSSLPSCCCCCCSWGASAISTVSLSAFSSCVKLSSPPYLRQFFLFLPSLCPLCALSSLSRSCCGERGRDELDSTTHRWAPSLPSLCLFSCLLSAGTGWMKWRHHKFS